MYKVTLKIADYENSKVFKTKEEAEDFKWEIGWEMKHDGETDYEILIEEEK